MDLQTLVNTVKIASQAAGLKITGSDKIDAAKATGRTLITARDINKINSIKGKARDSIAQYPVLVSENINPKLVPILTNALEVEYSSLVWLVISNASSFESGDGSSVIQQFHNLNGGIKEDTFLCGVEMTHQLYEANKDLLQPYEDSFNMSTLNESYYTGSLMEYLSEANNNGNNNGYNYDSKMKKKEFDEKLKQNKIKNKQWGMSHASTVAKDKEDRKRKEQERSDKLAKDERDFAYKQSQDRQSQAKDERDFAYKQSQDRQSQANNERDFAMRAAADRRSATRDRIGNVKSGLDMVNTGVNIATNISREIDRKKDRAMSKKQFDDDQAQRNYNAGRATVQTSLRDLNKVNDLHPTILNIEVNFREPGTNSVVNKQLSIGVKCVSHLLKSEDIQYYLTKASYKNSGLLRLIKWTTGEIKFWKDLIFTMDDIKLSALQNAKTVSNKNYFSKLEYIAKTSKQAILTGAKKDNVPSAITTLIISKTDVENIKYKDGVNILSNPEYLKKIFNNYYLLNLLIVDESIDVVYTYDQFSNSIKAQPFSSYEKSSKERVVNANDLFKLAR